MRAQMGNFCVKRPFPKSICPLLTSSSASYYASDAAREAIKINKRSIYSDDVKYIDGDHQRKISATLFIHYRRQMPSHFINSLCIRIINKLLRPHPIHHLSYSYLLFNHNFFRCHNSNGILCKKRTMNHAIPTHYRTIG